MIDSKTLEDSAIGRWAGIYESLGIPIPENKKHGPCPCCGGTDRFRCDGIDDDGRWFCNQCTPQSGNGLSLVMKCLKVGFPEALKKVAEVVGMVEVKNTNNQPREDPKGALNSLWGRSTVLTGSDTVSKYLHNRGLVLTPDNVRYCDSCYESDTRLQFPAMVARVQNKEGRPVSLHRTYLVENKKADIESPKKLMTGTEKLTGGAVRLFSLSLQLVADDVLGVAEGIETAIACTQLFQIATWACLSSSILENFDPPEGIKKIIVMADNDSNFVGQKAAYKLANRLYKQDLIVEVWVPEEAGTDWNDVLIKGC